VFNSSILDNLIALVVVILALSLIVQSVQQGFKKLLKIKSRQLEESLLDLFENVLAKAGTEESAVSPILNMLPFRRSSIDKTPADVKILYTAVQDEFKKLGRVAQSGKLMLDSIAKEDLLKVLRKIAPGNLLPGINFGESLQTACDQITQLDKILQGIDANLLSGAASAKFAALRDHLTPIINDFSAVTTGGKVNPGLAIEHVLEMRQISLTGVFDLLGELQDSVEKQYQTASGPDKIALDALSAGLRDVAAKLNELRQHVDAALAPLRTRIAQVDTWFDTVMQSFDERYTRGMKTWGLVISFVVVVIMNANVFEIYRNITGNDQARNSIIQMADTVKKAALSAAPAAPDQQTATINTIKDSVNQTQQSVNLYQQFQFQPLTWNVISNWLNGKCYAKDETPWGKRGDDLRVLLGWIFMTMLLSVGAPFWEDALESLFGVKNLIRRKGSIKNVEGESGAGNPKS